MLSGRKEWGTDGNKEGKGWDIWEATCNLIEVSNFNGGLLPGLY